MRPPALQELPSCWVKVGPSLNRVAPVWACELSRSNHTVAFVFLYTLLATHSLHQIQNATDVALCFRRAPKETRAIMLQLLAHGFAAVLGHNYRPLPAEAHRFAFPTPSEVASARPVLRDLLRNRGLAEVRRSESGSKVLHVLPCAWCWRVHPRTRPHSLHTRMYRPSLPSCRPTQRVRCCPCPARRSEQPLTAFPPL